MSESERGQGGQAKRPRYGGAGKDERWRTVPVEELRAFARTLFLKYRLRGSAERLGLKREAVRKFILGETIKPHDANRKKLGEAWLRYTDSRGVAERLAPVEPPDPAEMRLVFADRDAAHRLINRIHDAFRAAAAGDGEALSQAEALRSMLRRLADAGFATGSATYEELRATPPRRKPRAPKPSADSEADEPAPPKPAKAPRKRRKSGDDADGG